MLEEFVSEVCFGSLAELNLDVRNRMMGDSLKGESIVVEEAIDVVEPAGVLYLEVFASESLDVPFTEKGRTFCDLFGSVALVIRDEAVKLF